MDPLGPYVFKTFDIIRLYQILITEIVTKKNRIQILLSMLFISLLIFLPVIFFFLTYIHYHFLVICSYKRIVTSSFTALLSFDSD